MSPYYTSPGGSGPGPVIYNEDYDSDSDAASDHGGSDYELESDDGGEEVESFVEPVESNSPKMPLPPMELLTRDAEEFIMEFMFLPRPSRMREVDMEFYCLSWKPVTFQILERCCEYISEKLVALMNENAELEREVKGLGPRRTAVLTKKPYEHITVELMRKEKWNRKDVIWCVCEGMKKFPKELSRNQRFKTRLSLPVPGKDYDIIRGIVQNEMVKRYPKEGKKDEKKKKKAVPAAKVGGVRRKAPNKRAGTLTTKKSNNDKQPKSTSKRTVKDNNSEADFNATNATPKKKGRTAATASSSKQPTTPSRSLDKAGTTATAGSSTQTPPNSDDVGTNKRGRKRGKAHFRYNYVDSPVPGYVASNDDGYASDMSSTTLTQENYDERGV